MFCGAVFEVKYGMRLGLVSSLLKESEKMNGLLRMMSCPRQPSETSSSSSSLGVVEERDNQTRVDLGNDLQVLSCLKNVSFFFFFLILVFSFLCFFFRPK